MVISATYPRLTDRIPVRPGTAHKLAIHAPLIVGYRQVSTIAQ
jgi:hypothetical protein